LSRNPACFLSEDVGIEALEADLSVATEERIARAKFRICFDGERFGDSMIGDDCWFGISVFSSDVDIGETRIVSETGSSVGEAEAEPT
jgi:hypothetical protein